MPSTTRYVAVERRDTQSVSALLSEYAIDAVVDVIPMHLNDTEPLLKQLSGQVAQYVMISSCDVYANYELLHKKSVGEPQLGSIDEDAPLRVTRYPYRGSTPRAASDPDQYLDDYEKIVIEEAVQRMTCDWTILRLPMVFGPGDKQRRFAWAITPMRAGHEVVTLPTSWARWCSTYEYVENVGSAVARTLGSSKAARSIFNVAEREPRAHLDWASRLAQACEYNGRIELTDDPDHPLARSVAELDLSVPFMLCADRIRDAMGDYDVINSFGALLRTVADEASR